VRGVSGHLAVHLHALVIVRADAHRRRRQRTSSVEIWTKRRISRAVPASDTELRTLMLCAFAHSNNTCVPFRARAPTKSDRRSNTQRQSFKSYENVVFGKLNRVAKRVVDMRLSGEMQNRIDSLTQQETTFTTVSRFAIARESEECACGNLGREQMRHQIGRANVAAHKRKVRSARYSHVAPLSTYERGRHFALATTSNVVPGSRLCSDEQ
jgi:hypothetical protein